MSMKLGPTQ